MLTQLFDLALPRHCAGCGASASLLCPACREPLSRAAGPVYPQPAPPGLPPPWGVAVYSGPVRSAILAYKERGRVGLTGVLAEALARAVWTAADGVGLLDPAHPSGESASLCPTLDELVLVPVPARRREARHRGYDPVRRLAGGAAGALRGRGRPARTLTVLAYARAAVDQSGLGAGDRVANLSGALAVPSFRAHLARGRRVVLVDDVVTTGATLAEASRALRAAGAEVACAAVVAATRRRRHHANSRSYPLHSEALEG